MNKDQIIAYLKERDIKKIKFAFADIDGILRGKVINAEKFADSLNDGFGFCDVVFGWDCTDTCYDNVQLTGWRTGYPDKLCQIDLDTFRTVPWDENIPFFLGDFSKIDGDDLPACSRSLLRKIAGQCAELGFHPEFAQEFEWFNYAETPQMLKSKGYINLETLTPGMFGYSILRTSLNPDFYRDLFDQLLQFNVPLEGIHTETGPGVYEAALAHDEVLAAADKAVLFKTGVKEIAARYGITATFMAKISESLPGCSGHIHQSLWSADKKTNLFYAENDLDKMSELHKQYLAGQLYCIPHMLPMFAPTINSYKRLVEGAWAPTTNTWGIENRTTALRVINTSEKLTRLETRIPGADTNPYLAMSAALAAGLYGIKNKLALTVPETVGNGYLNETNGCLPANLYDATMQMKNSTIASELFGKAFIDHFTQTRLWECRQYAKAVTNWELKRYLEII